MALINYIYFSKIAQRAVHRTNYLGTVAASYAFNHNLDVPGALVDSLSPRPHRAGAQREHAAQQDGARRLHLLARHASDDYPHASCQRGAP